MQLNANSSLLTAATTRSPTVKILLAYHAAWKKISSPNSCGSSFHFPSSGSFLGFVLIGKFGIAAVRNESPIPKETTSGCRSAT